MATAGDGDYTGYYVMKDCHDKAYALITEALDMDESGIGDKEAVIDYYSQGVAQFEKGINVSLSPSDPNIEKAEKLRSKMMKNLEMAKDRVQNLLDGKDLKGSTSSLIPKNDKVSPKSSSVLKPDQWRQQNKGKISPGYQKMKNNRLAPHYPGVRRGMGSKPTSRAASDKEKKTKIEIKGVDQILVETIMNEIQDKDTAVLWGDIVGLEQAKRTLQEIVVLPTLNPELFVGLRSPAKGLLLFGPPGNGKTMLAKAVAHESKSTFFSISASSLTSKYVGEGEKLVRALFAVARACQPSIVFIDEVDSLLSRRGDGEHDAMRRMKNEFLLQFDGMGSSEGERLLVMGATNRPDEIDDAALRRFTKRIYVPLPDFEARMTSLGKLLNKHTHDMNDTQLGTIASYTESYSFSDLTALAKDAALGPIRELNMESLKSIRPEQIRPINFEDFRRSLSQIRPSVAVDKIKELEEWNRLYGIGV